jgi:hypothetical protein
MTGFKSLANCQNARKVVPLCLEKFINLPVFNIL